jgi:hypothetical protein
MIKLLGLVLILTSFIRTSQPAAPPIQDPVIFEGINVRYVFGQEVTFQAVIRSAVPIQTTWLLIQPAGWALTMHEVSQGIGGAVEHQFTAGKIPLRPYAEAVYWYRVRLDNGVEVDSQQQTFRYEDNLHKWNWVGNDVVEILLYDGDNEFTVMASGMIEQGLASARQFYPVELTQPLRIYIYASREDLQQALGFNIEPSLGGLTFPDIGVILVPNPDIPGKDDELKRVLTHELTHVLAYQYYGSGYDLLPKWMKEGSASLTDYAINPIHSETLQYAARTGMLLPLVSLCDSFPQDPAKNILAYSESASLVNFLYHRFGAEGLEEISRQYIAGENCENGIRKTTGMTLNQIQHVWEEEVLGVNPNFRAFRNISPYGLLLILVIILPLVSTISGRRK